MVYQRYIEKHEEIVPIWLMVELLTFNEIIELYKILNEKDRFRISQEYDLNSKDYEEYIENIKDIRNLSAHNRNIIDLRFTKEINISKDIGSKIFEDKKIASSIYILEYLIKKINPAYLKGLIKTSLINICEKDDNLARKLGFLNYEEIKLIKL